MSQALFTLPEDLVSLSDFLFTDPTSGNSLFPLLDQIAGNLAGQPITAYSMQSIPRHTNLPGEGDDRGPGSYNIRKYDPIIPQAAAIYNADQSVLPFLSWWNGDDPRADIAAAAQGYNLGSLGLDTQQSLLGSLPGGIVAEAAIKHRLGAMGVPEADITNILGQMLTRSGAGGLPSLSLDTGFQQYSYASNGGDQTIDYRGTPESNPYRPFMDQVLDALNAPTATNYRNGNTSYNVSPTDPYRAWTNTLGPGGLPNIAAVNDFDADIGGQTLRAILAESGITLPTTVGNTTTLPGGNTVTTNNNQGVQPSPLNYMAPFLSLLGGGYPGLDDEGNPTWTSLSDDQWQAIYGQSGLFGPDQRDDIQDLLTPLGLSTQEQAARDLLSGDPAKRAQALAKYPELKTALDSMDAMMPAIQGQLAPTIPLFQADQYNRVKELAETGNRDILTKGATQYLQKEVAPQLAAAFGGQLGTFGSDFGGELAHQGRMVSSDLAELISNNMNTGTGMWNDMTSSQGLYDTQRLGTMAPLYQGLLGARASLPMSFATDLSNFGGSARTTDEAMRPGRIAMDLYRTLLTGASPSNLGYVAQGQLPSETASWLNGMAGQSANFGSGFGSLATSFVNGLGSQLAGNLFSGGGFDGSGSAGLLGDLGGLLSSGAGALWSGLSGLFGGGSGGSAFDWTGGDGNDFWNVG